MKMGMTFDLRRDYLEQGLSMEQTAELDKPETIEAIERVLHSLGFEVERIGNAVALCRLLAAGQSWDMVFNICEGIFGSGRESLVPCLLDYHRIPYVFSGPAVMALCLHKGFCKRAVRDLGLPTGWFHVVWSMRDIKEIAMEFPAFVKPVSEGTGKGISQRSLVNSQKELEVLCRELFAAFDQPLLVEEYLPGKEVTVGLVGSGSRARAVGVMEVILGAENIYSYQVKENYEHRVQYGLVHGKLKQESMELALKAWQGLGCLDGGRVDLRQDKHGRMTFMEINPLAGLNPIHSDLPILCRLAGWSYEQLLTEIIMSALSRHGLEMPVEAVKDSPVQATA